MEKFLPTLVQLGFHGTALAFLYLGYQLLRKVLDEKPGTATAGRTLQLKIRTIWVFLGFSFLFFVAGVAFQIWGPRLAESGTRPLAVQLVPIEMPAGLPAPILYLAESQLQFGKGGRTEAPITAKSYLTISTEGLSRAIEERIRKAEVQQAVATAGVGIGDDPVAREVGLTDQVLATAPRAQVEAKVEELKAKIENPAQGEDSSVALASLGWAYYSLGRTDDAKATLEQAAKEADDPKTKARVNQNLSRVLELQGDLAGAKRVIREVPDASGRGRLRDLERVGAAQPPK